MILSYGTELNLEGSIQTDKINSESGIKCIFIVAELGDITTKSNKYKFDHFEINNY